MNRITWMFLLLLSGCQGWLGGSLYTESTSSWYETGQVRKDKEEVIRIVREVLLRQGYSTTEFDADQTHAETCWDTHFSTMWREGVRTKLEAQILPLTGGGFNVRVRSSMQLNDNALHPTIPEKAEWVGAGVSDKHKDHIPDQAIKVHMLLKNRFFGMNP